MLLFKKDLIEEGQLENGPTESVYKAENKELCGQFRDTAKYYKKTGITISSFGIENQSVTDYDMPIRIMGYDYSSYRSQIDAGKNRYPVITVMLNFSDKRWTGPLHLKDMFEIPEGMKDFVKDYEITVFDIAFLSDEIINKFKSTFKHVAHFFKYRRFPDEYQPLNEKIEHLEAFLDLLEVFTGDNKYAEIKDELLSRQKEGDEVTMCSIVEKFTNDGIKQGIEQDRKQIILNMHKKGCDAVTISDLSGISFEVVNEVLGQNFSDDK
ncbi:MAG: Rpn family recombination-promoting nuclease/putative transposase [Lachnospiraceae bacterium]|nr:Rpn family recombination-promoting nuclease/putative transposase [Lachnospiraceae bacterium]